MNEQLPGSKLEQKFSEDQEEKIERALTALTNNIDPEDESLRFILGPMQNISMLTNLGIGKMRGLLKKNGCGDITRADLHVIGDEIAKRWIQEIGYKSKTEE